MFPGSKPSLRRDRGDVLSGVLTQPVDCSGAGPQHCPPQVVWVPLGFRIENQRRFSRFRAARRHRRGIRTTPEKLWSALIGFNLFREFWPGTKRHSRQDVALCFA